MIIIKYFGYDTLQINIISYGFYIIVCILYLYITHKEEYIKRMEFLHQYTIEDQ